MPHQSASTHFQHSRRPDCAPRISTRVVDSETAARSHYALHAARRHGRAGIRAGLSERSRRHRFAPLRELPDQLDRIFVHRAISPSWAKQ